MAKFFWDLILIFWVRILNSSGAHEKTPHNNHPTAKLLGHPIQNHTKTSSRSPILSIVAATFLAPPPRLRKRSKPGRPFRDQGSAGEIIDRHFRLAAQRNVVRLTSECTGPSA